MLSPFLSRCLAVLRTYNPPWWVRVLIMSLLILNAVVVTLIDGDDIQERSILLMFLAAHFMMCSFTSEMLKEQLASDRNRLLPGYFWPHLLVALGLMFLFFHLAVITWFIFLSVWLPGVLAFGLFFTVCFGASAWVKRRAYWVNLICLPIWASLYMPSMTDWYWNAVLLGGHPNVAWAVIIASLTGLLFVVWKARMLCADCPEYTVPTVFHEAMSQAGGIASLPNSETAFFDKAIDRKLTKLLDCQRGGRWWRMSMYEVGHGLVRPWTVAISIGLIVAGANLLASALLSDPTIVTIFSNIILFMVPVAFSSIRLKIIRVMIETEMLRPEERWEYGRDRFAWICFQTCGIWLLVAAPVLTIWWWNAQLSQPASAYAALLAAMPIALMLGLMLGTWTLLLLRSSVLGLISIFISTGAVYLVVFTILDFQSLIYDGVWENQSPAITLAGFLVISAVLAVPLAMLAGRRWMRIDLV